jgi:hypothetical protein
VKRIPELGELGRMGDRREILLVGDTRLPEVSLPTETADGTDGGRIFAPTNKTPSDLQISPTP